MTLNIWCSDKLRVDWKDFSAFIQHQTNRLAFGEAQYGKPDQRKKYMSRLKEELKAYKRTGDREHLLNIANYAWLENKAPENPKFHWDNTVDSVTRGKV